MEKKREGRRAVTYTLRCLIIHVRIHIAVGRIIGAHPGGDLIFPDLRTQTNTPEYASRRG